MPVEFARLKEGALDESSEVMAVAERFRPTHVLHLGPSDVMTRNSVQKVGDNFVEFSSNVTVTFFFKLMLSQDGTTVWRSDATFYTIPRPNAVADQMVNQLTKAGLL